MEESKGDPKTIKLPCIEAVFDKVEEPEMSKTLDQEHTVAKSKQKQKKKRKTKPRAAILPDDEPV